ncbi:MAG: hypothetical protein HY602_00520 [Parcubacteria group bacterium]|nr:hypothetical protein [Parcubacteria group bacterium]
MRKTIRQLIDGAENETEAIRDCLDELKKLRLAYSSLEHELQESNCGKLAMQTYHYVDEFWSLTWDYYLTGLLNELKEKGLEELMFRDISQMILEEKQRRESAGYRILAKEDVLNNEKYLYRKGILNKFILDVLLLSVIRTHLATHYGWVIGAIAAGIAMLLYLLLSVIWGQRFVIGSLPFLVATSVMYIVKDRIKEGIKFYYQNQGFRWFPDYQLKIQTPDGVAKLGHLTESFNFVSLEDMPSEVKALRQKGFSSELEEQGRPEEVFKYKKDVVLYTERLLRKGARRHDINDILRFNIRHFLIRASDPYEAELFLDTKTKKIQRILCPKIYHINLIIKRTFWGKEEKQKVELQRVRLIIDKEGIKRVEYK